jgi:hypothetical protein
MRHADALAARPRGAGSEAGRSGRAVAAALVVAALAVVATAPDFDGDAAARPSARDAASSAIRIRPESAPPRVARAPAGDEVPLDDLPPYDAAFAARAYTPAAVDDDPEVKAAAEGALRWLARAQGPDGAWRQDLGHKAQEDYQVTRSARPHVGVTALALMAFLAGGHLPGRGPYGKVVEKGTDFVLSCVDAQDGYVAFEGSRMYSHAFATLFLAEILGMTHRADVKDKLQRAANLSAASQNDAGSWRYEPYSPESDMSITVCQVMALRAARNVGVRVNKRTIDRAYDYVVRSAETSGPERGGFHYQEKERTRTSFALTAAGVATLHHTGVYDHDLVRAGEAYLRREFEGFHRRYAGHFFYWYGHYYAAQVFFTGSDPSDPSRDGWGSFYWPGIRRQLLGLMQASPRDATAHWRNTVGPGDVFSTAVAAIILQIPYQYLPIFQR